MTRIVPEGHVMPPHLAGDRQGKAGPGFSLALRNAIAAALSADGRIEGEAAGRTAAAETEADTSDGLAKRGEGRETRIELARLLSTTRLDRSSAGEDRTAHTPARGETGETGKGTTERAPRQLNEALVSTFIDVQQDGGPPGEQSTPATDPGDAPNGRGEPHLTAETRGSDPRGAGRTDRAARDAAERQPTARPHPQPAQSAPEANSASSRAAFETDARVNVRAEGGQTGATRQEPSAARIAVPARDAQGEQTPSTPQRRAANGPGPLASQAESAPQRGEMRTQRGETDTRLTAQHDARADTGATRPGRAETIANMAPVSVNDVQRDPRQRPAPLRSAEASSTAEALATKVTRRETHFAPVMMPQRSAAITTQPSAPSAPIPSDQPSSASDPRAATEQLGRFLESTLPDLKNADGRLPQLQQSANEGMVRALAAQRSGPVRVVELQLQPATLGTLTVTMRLSASGLKVNVSASLRETATRLSEDRAELTQLIRKAGYEASEITVEAATGAQSFAGGDEAPSREGRQEERGERRERQPGPELRGRRTIHV